MLHRSVASRGTNAHWLWHDGMKMRKASIRATSDSDRRSVSIPRGPHYERRRGSADSRRHLTRSFGILGMQVPAARRFGRMCIWQWANGSSVLRLDSCPQDSANLKCRPTPPGAAVGRQWTYWMLTLALIIRIVKNLLVTTPHPPRSPTSPIPPTQQDRRDLRVPRRRYTKGLLDSVSGDLTTSRLKPLRRSRLTTKINTQAVLPQCTCMHDTILDDDTQQCATVEWNAQRAGVRGQVFHSRGNWSVEHVTDLLTLASESTGSHDSTRLMNQLSEDPVGDSE